jgi:glucose-1-phosphate cytidylyltransferase
MKVVILAGGYGTRISEYTDTIPKPMIEIGGLPIIWHIMNRYAYFGYKDFYIALGYKAEVIKEFFLKYHTLNSDFSVDLSSGEIKYHNLNKLDWKVTLVDTGKDTMTGGRLLRLKTFLDKDTFMLTYGDGLSNINLEDLYKFHKSHKKMVTVSAVHPTARFGELEIYNDTVVNFKEKPQLNDGWINGGFFVLEPEFLNLIENDETMLEREPLEKATKLNEFMAFQHKGFWHCMDTKRDYELLEAMWKSGAPWICD